MGQRNVFERNVAFYGIQDDHVTVYHVFLERVFVEVICLVAVSVRYGVSRVVIKWLLNRVTGVIVAVAVSAYIDVLEGRCVSCMLQ